MLQEVSSTVGLIRLGARASVDPNSDCSCLCMGVRLCCNSKTVGERRYLCEGRRGDSGSERTGYLLTLEGKVKDEDDRPVRKF